jgi:myo-inositol 2-dehydrogenase/D-chiro-inositol 1-dehydrogenase
MLAIGVVGVGRIGKMHAQIIARELTGASLVAVADANADLASSVAEQLQVRALTVDELMNSPDIDAVAICSSTDTHVGLIEKAAFAGKAIFCEKPISLNLDEVDRAIAAIKENQVPFMVGFNRRFDPAHASVHNAIAKGVIGAVHLARISSRDSAPPPVAYIKVSGGIFVDMMIHDFDMTGYLVDSPVVEVFAKGAVRIDPAIGEAGDIDTAMVMLTHADGTITTIDNSRQAVYGYDQRVEVFGEKGMAASENPPTHSGMVRTSEGTSTPGLPFLFLDRYLDSYRLQWQAFINYVEQGGESPVSADAGRIPVVLAQACSQSLRTGLPVIINN